MEQIEITKLDDQALETMRCDLAQQIQELPEIFKVNGTVFSWTYSRRSKSLSISSRNMMCYTINLDGSIASYSFGSTSGKNEQDAVNAIQYYQTCAYLLSEHFRMAVLQDYQAKESHLKELEAAYDLILGEEYRRKEDAENTKKAIKRQETAECRKR